MVFDALSEIGKCAETADRNAFMLEQFKMALQPIAGIPCECHIFYR